MASDPAQYRIRGPSAAAIIASVERGVSTGRLAPGDTIPSVRALAHELGISPTTVARAYSTLRQRGVLVSHDRSWTRIAQRASGAGALAPALQPGVVDLASGDPDPDLLPDLTPALQVLKGGKRLYGGAAGVDGLVELARVGFADDGVPASHVAVAGGGLDGLERVLAVHLSPGDRIGLEDPGDDGALDLVRTLGLVPVPVPVDDHGPTVEGLGSALGRGLHALLVTPRAQNPTGAAIGSRRAAGLREILTGHPGVLVVEDDPASLLAGVRHHPLIIGRERWAVIRSLTGALGPDLRTAVLAADQVTVARLLERQRLGTRWVSHLLQQLTATAWMQARTDGTLARARATYDGRREAFLDALSGHGVRADGRTGTHVWIPVTEESPAAQDLRDRGWAVRAGSAFRIASAPAIRVTTAGLRPARARALAADVAAVLDHGGRSPQDG